MVDSASEKNGSSANLDRTKGHCGLGVRVTSTEDYESLLHDVHACIRDYTRVLDEDTIGKTIDLLIDGRIFDTCGNKAVSFIHDFSKVSFRLPFLRMYLVAV